MSEGDWLRLLRLPGCLALPFLTFVGATLLAHALWPSRPFKWTLQVALLAHLLVGLLLILAAIWIAMNF